MARSSQAFPPVPSVRTRVHQATVPSGTKSSSSDGGIRTSRRKRVKRRISSTSSSERPAAPDEPEIRSRLLTHSPIIHAPVPIRHARSHFSLSDTYDSEDTNSALAQPARAVPLVPTSQQSENNIWRNWLESASGSVQTDKAVEGSLASIYWPPVSPGISEAVEQVRGRRRSSTKLLQSSPRAIDQTNKNEKYASDDMISSDSSFIVNRDREPVDWEEPEEHKIMIEHPLRYNPADEEKVKAHNTKIGHPPRNVPARKHELQNRKPLIDPSFRYNSPEKQTVEEHKFEVEHSPRYSPQPAGHQTLDRLERNAYDLPTAYMEQQESDPEPSTEDPEEAWKAFVLRGVDSDDIEQAAFEEAKHDAAMYIRPSEPSSEDTDQRMSDAVSNVATVGTQLADQVSHSTPADGDEKDEFEDRFETESAAELVPNCSSIEVEMSIDGYEGFGYISSSLSADSMASDPSYETSISCTQAPTMEARVSSSSLDSDDMVFSTCVQIKGSDILSQPPTSSLSEPQPPSTTSGLAPSSSLSEAQPESTVSGLDSLAVRPPKPEIKTSVPSNFRFAPPKLFVGSRSNQLKKPAPLETVSLAKPRRGSRQKRRASDGRANIRALPNYSSDPIEEIEDEVRDPIFGPLELESS